MRKLLYHQQLWPVLVLIWLRGLRHDEINSGRSHYRKQIYNVVHGLGTAFLTALSVGNVINIGYHNYVVQNVVSDDTFAVENTLLEDFNVSFLWTCPCHNGPSDQATAI